MNEENISKTEQDQQNDIAESHQYEVYGWEFHKKPLLYAGILTVLFYIFIFFYINV